ncbi:uncharacterized protein F23B12.7-like isoform X1 [Asparagus officinalis]|uniref:uncharacterized protein F23B12.7-like isoform X1 n=1 Tax=Asparagus officinalis TaxID=4686 RepID=UPI00098E7376|nr:uncharacterized protein F23B12.7-like isoform X1 [Asparagus officinalis]
MKTRIRVPGSQDLTLDWEVLEKYQVITEADLDQLIHEKKVELNLLLKMKREIFGGRQEDVDSDSGDEDDVDDEDDSDGGDEDGRNEEDDRDVGEGEGESDDGVGDEGGGGDVDEDDGDVDRMNVDKDDGGDGANDDVDMDSIEVDDDAFLLSPRDIAVIEDKRKTPSVKRTVLSRSRLVRPSTRSPFVPLCN